MNTLRLLGDPANSEGEAINRLTRQPSYYAPGNAFAVQVGLFERQPTYGLSRPVQVKDLAYLKLEIKALLPDGSRPDESVPPEIEATIPNALLDDTLDEDNWRDESKENCTFIFTDAQAANSLAGRKLIIIQGVTLDATPATVNYLVAELECIEDGGPSVVPAPPPGYGSAGGIGHSFLFDGSSTAPGDPGSGKIRADNADSALIANFFVSYEDLLSNDLGDYFRGFKGGDSLHLQHLGNADNVGSYLLSGDAVDNTTYVTLPVSPRTHSGAFPDAVQVALYLQSSSAATGGYVHPNHSGEVHSVGDGPQTIQPRVVTPVKIPESPPHTLSGRKEDSTGDIQNFKVSSTTQEPAPDASLVVLGENAGGTLINVSANLLADGENVGSEGEGPYEGKGGAAGLSLLFRNHIGLNGYITISYNATNKTLEHNIPANALPLSRLNQAGAYQLLANISGTPGNWAGITQASLTDIVSPGAGVKLPAWDLDGSLKSVDGSQLGGGGGGGDIGAWDIVLRDAPTLGPATPRRITEITTGTQLHTVQAMLIVDDGAGIKSVLSTDVPNYYGGHLYGFDSATGAADPTTNLFRLNNANPAAATALYISKTYYDVSGTASNIGPYLLGHGADDTVYIQGVVNGSRANVASYTITGSLTDNGTWVSVPIAADSVSNTFAEFELHMVNFRPGAAGAVGGITGADNLAGLGAGVFKNEAGGILYFYPLYGPDEDLVFAVDNPNNRINLTIASNKIILTKIAKIDAQSLLANPTGSIDDVVAVTEGGLADIADLSAAINLMAWDNLGQMSKVSSNLFQAKSAPAWTIAARNAATPGARVDIRIDELLEETNPTAGHWALGALPTGELRKFNTSNIGGGISKVEDDPNPTLGGDLNWNGYKSVTQAGHAALSLSDGAGGTPVNYVNIRNSAAGIPVFIEALGTDPDISIILNAKGNGIISDGAFEFLNTHNTINVFNKTISHDQNRLRDLPEHIAWNGYGSVENGTYVILLEWRGDYALTLDVGSFQAMSSGTCTASIEIDGAPVTGLSSIAVSTTKTLAAATAANVLSLGQRLSLAVTAASSLVDLSISLKGEYDKSPA